MHGVLLPNKKKLNIFGIFLYVWMAEGLFYYNYDTKNQNRVQALFIMCLL